MTEDKIGLAFSGGGIRSAALSSGVLRRLLHRGVNVDYISCVSGGNYTAASYLDWKYRNNNADHADWHKTFFEYMRSRAGFVCNWERPLQGILDTVILVLLLITINLVIPCVIYSSGAFPVAFVINYAFGSILCKGLNTTGSTVNTSATIPPCTSGYVKGDPKVQQQFLLFVLLSISFIVFHTIKVVAAFHRISLAARYLQILTGVLFAFTFLPWLIHQFMDALTTWLNICVFVLSIFFWLGFPPLRRKASLAFVLYFYAFVIKWRVYQTKVMGIPYNDHQFYILLLVSSGLIWISPYLGMFSTTASFTYYKWRLQKAFFTPESVGSLCGCGGISFSDFFPILSCCDHQHNPSNDPLVMEDLKDVSPEYISNVAVDYWRIKPSLRESSYAVMSMSPMANERIDHHPGDSVEIKLLPRCVHQADAMVASAAVMALSPKQNEPFRDLQVMLGLTLRKGFRSNPDETMGCSPFSSKIFAVLIQSIAAFPMMFLAIIALVHWDRKDEELYVMAVFVAYYVVFVAWASLSFQQGVIHLSVVIISS